MHPNEIAMAPLVQRYRLQAAKSTRNQTWLSL